MKALDNDLGSSSLPYKNKSQMKKLQSFVIISSFIFAAYVFAPDFLTTPVVYNPYVNFGFSHQSAQKAAKHNRTYKILIFSKFFAYSYISPDVLTVDIQSDSDIDDPEVSKINDHEVTLMASTFEGAQVLTTLCSAVELFRFPSEAYRLRI